MATLYPRLALLGGLPGTDEGIYASGAQAIHDSVAAGRGLPDHGWLYFYPMLLSWVFSIDGNHMLLLRFVDMLVAVYAGWLLFTIASRESGDLFAGAAIAAVFCFAMNQQAFVQYGFRNSMFAAYIPLLMAIRVGLWWGPRKSATWWLCGALVAMAVLLRETFVYFAVLGFMAVFVAHGWRNALHYLVGGMFAAGVAIALLSLGRGGIVNIVQAYLHAGDAYSGVADMRWQRLRAAFATAAIEGAAALPFAVVGLAGVLVSVRQRVPDTKRWLFWLAVALVPLLEPVLKIGYAYHIAVSAIGLCGLASLVWRKYSRAAWRSTGLAVACVLVGSSVILSWLQLQKLNVGIWERLANVRAIGERDWPRQAIPQNNYLLLAAAIRDAERDGVTLAVSGNALGLFPLTGMLPSTHTLHDLSATARRVRHDGGALRGAIVFCPPDILMVTSRPQKVYGRDAILEAVTGMAEYSEVANLPVAQYKDLRAYPGGREVEHPPSGSIYRRSTRSLQCDVGGLESYLERLSTRTQ
jgi:hypothetical protein